MIYRHWSHAPWNSERWPNFHPEKDNLVCSYSGEYYHHPDSLDRLQWTRNVIGKPINLSSGHRSFLYNKMVKGAQRSEHLRIAFDVKIENHDRHELLAVLREAGFKAFGLYNSFIHVDMRLINKIPAFWYGKGAKSSWQS